MEAPIGRLVRRRSFGHLRTQESTLRCSRSIHRAREPLQERAATTSAPTCFASTKLLNEYLDRIGVEKSAMTARIGLAQGFWRENVLVSQTATRHCVTKPRIVEALAGL